MVENIGSDEGSRILGSDEGSRILGWDAQRNNILVAKVVAEINNVAKFVKYL
ncbi:MAG: hypothetical protein KKF50_01945 [Nanoarchaeota archaeon]|nr:hypothetical protein [Nanoarchaeota archaeon]